MQARASRLAVVGGIAVLVAGACARAPDPPRIVYPYQWLKGDLDPVVQPAIDALRPRRVAEIPDSLMAQITVSPGYAGDVEWAEATAAIPRVAVAVGPMSSRATLLVAPIYAERSIPLIVPTATSDRLRDLGPWVFQLAPDNASEGAFIARFVLGRLAARRITIFYLDADEYGLSLRDGVEHGLRLARVPPVDEVGFIEEADLPRRVAESLRRAVPDAVVVAARTAEALAIAKAVHARLPGVPVVAGDGVPLSASLIRDAGAAADEVYAVAWWSAEAPDSLARAFTASYRRARGAPPSAPVAMYYDAIMLAAEAVREAGPRPAAVRRWLSGLGTERPPYRGVTGPISFAAGRPVNLLMTRIAGGAVAVVADARSDRGGEQAP